MSSICYLYVHNNLWFGTLPKDASCLKCLIYCCIKEAYWMLQDLKYGLHCNYTEFTTIIVKSILTYLPIFFANNASAKINQSLLWIVLSLLDNLAFRTTIEHKTYDCFSFHVFWVNFHILIGLLKLKIVYKHLKRPSFQKHVQKNSKKRYFLHLGSNSWTVEKQFEITNLD